MSNNQLVDSKKNRTYYPLLDLFRAIAAFFVVLEHTRNFLWVDYPQLEDPTIFIRIIYFFSGFGSEFVLIFFVLSGCVVGRIPVDSIRNDKKWDWLDYLIARVTRLWVVLIPALALTFILDSISMQLAPSDSFVFNSNGCAHRALDQVVSEHLHLTDFIGNVFFVQTILVPTFGSNGALWSLANEFWYYMIFPFLIYSVFGNLKTILRIVYLFVAVLIMCFVGKDIIIAFPVWLVGVLAYYWGTKRTFSKSFINIGFIIGLISIGGALCASRLGLLNNWMKLSLIAVSFGLTVMCSLHIQVSSWISNVSSFFSSFSFSLYVIHTPILTLLVAPWIAGNEDRIMPDMYGFGLVIGVIIFIYLISWLFYLVTEKQTSKVRRFISNYIKWN